MAINFANLVKRISGDAMGAMSNALAKTPHVDRRTPLERLATGLSPVAKTFEDPVAEDYSMGVPLVDQAVGINQFDDYAESQRKKQLEALGNYVTQNTRTPEEIHQAQEEKKKAGENPGPVARSLSQAAPGFVTAVDFAEKQALADSIPMETPKEKYDEIMESLIPLGQRLSGSAPKKEDQSDGSLPKEEATTYQPSESEGGTSNPGSASGGEGESSAKENQSQRAGSSKRLMDELMTFGFGPKSIYDLLGEGSEYWESDAGKKFLEDNPDFIVDQYTIPRLQMPGQTPYWMALAGMTDDGVYEVPGLRRAFEQAGVNFDDSDYEGTANNFDNYFYLNGYDLDPWLDNPIGFDYGHFGRDPYAATNLVSYLDKEYDWLSETDPNQAAAAYALVSLRDNPDLWGGLSDEMINRILHEFGGVDWSLGPAAEGKNGLPSYTDISGLSAKDLTSLMNDEFWPQLVAGLSGNYAKRRGSHLGYLSRGDAAKASASRNSGAKKQDADQSASSVIDPMMANVMYSTYLV